MGLLFMLAASTAGAFGLAGRSPARVLSYRLAIALAIVGPLLFAGSLSMSAIVEAQRYTGVWYVAFQPVAFLVAVAALAMTSRGEPSGSLAALAGYADAVVASALLAIVFLGGWSLPWTRGAVASAAVFAAKVVALVYAVRWVRWELERRYGHRAESDPLAYASGSEHEPRALGTARVSEWVPLERADLGWRWLVPAALANAVLTAAFLGVALGWRTPMGTGILSAATDEGLWIGWAGFAYFLLASAATVAIVAGLLATINRNRSSLASCE